MVDDKNSLLLKRSIGEDEINCRLQEIAGSRQCLILFICVRNSQIRSEYPRFHLQEIQVPGGEQLLHARFEDCTTESKSVPLA